MFISTDLANSYELESIFQSHLDMFQFDFMFVKPHDAPPLLCANVQIEMRFVGEQILFPEGRRCERSCSTPNLIWYTLIIDNVLGNVSLATDIMFHYIVKE